MRLGSIFPALSVFLFAGLQFCAANPSSPAAPIEDARSFQDASSQKHRSPAPSTDPAAAFAVGQTALQNGDLDKAEHAFRSVLAVDPRSGGAYANLGVIAMRREQWDKALRLLLKASQLEPKVSGIRLNIGLVYYRQGDYGAAVPWFSGVLRDQPESQQARYLLGLSNLFVEHYRDAAFALEPLWPQKSNDFMYLYVLSLAAGNSGRTDLNEKALARLIEVGGDSPQFHLLLAKAELNRQETDKAIADLDRAASGDPNLPFLHLNFGVAYMRLGDTQRAEAEFRREIALDPDLPDTYELLGDFYVRKGDDAEAEKCFRQALARNPKMPGSLFGVGNIYFHQRKYQQALAALDAAEKLTPDDQRYHFVRGQVLMRLGRREAGQAELAASQKLLDAGLNNERTKFADVPLPNPELRQSPQ